MVSEAPAGGAGPETAAALIARVLADASARRGRAAVALSGGSTPRRVYERLAHDRVLRGAMPWAATEFFWGDERWVAADHPDHNARMAIEACLAHVPVDPAQIHPMPTGAASPAAAALAYEALLAAHVPSADGLPQFDLLMLGMGDDGHTLSLFPGSAALHEAERACVAVPAPALEPRVPRLTLTPPVVRVAAHVLLLTSGPGKAAVLARIDAAPTDIDRYPIHLLRHAQGTVTRISL